MSDSPLYRSLSLLAPLYGFILSPDQLQDLSALREIPEPQRLSRLQNLLGSNPSAEFVKVVNFFLNSPLPLQSPLVDFLTTSTSVAAYPFSEQDPDQVRTLSSGVSDLLPSLPPSLSGLSPLLPHLLLADPTQTLSALVDLIYFVNHP